MEQDYITPLAIVNGEQKGYISEAYQTVNGKNLCLNVVLCDSKEGITDVLAFTLKDVKKCTCKFCPDSTNLLEVLKWTITMLQSLSTDENVQVHIKYTSKSVKFTFVNGLYGGNIMYFLM